jgi:hypothetical protein
MVLRRSLTLLLVALPVFSGCSQKSRKTNGKSNQSTCENPRLKGGSMPPGQKLAPSPLPPAGGKYWARIDRFDLGIDAATGKPAMLREGTAVSLRPAEDRIYEVRRGQPLTIRFHWSTSDGRRSPDGSGKKSVIWYYFTAKVPEPPFRRGNVGFLSVAGPIDIAPGESAGTVDVHFMFSEVPVADEIVLQPELPPLGRGNLLKIRVRVHD